MKLVAKIVALSIVTDDRSVGQAESLSGLLTDCNTGRGLAFTVAFCEFIRIGVALDRGAVLFCCSQVQVFDVVCPNRVCVSAGGRFADGAYAVPSVAIGVCVVSVEPVENYVVNTGLIEMLTNSIP